MEQRAIGRPVRHRKAMAAVGACFLLLGIVAGKATRQELSTECASGDATLAAHARAILVNPDPAAPLALGYVVASARLARGLCLGRHPERGARMYERLADKFETRTALAAARHEAGRARPR